MDQIASKNRRWGFILSTPRSGSTLLSVILSGHRQIIAPPELHLLRYANFDDWHQDYPVAMQSLCSLMESLGQDPNPETVKRVFSGKKIPGIYQDLLDLAPTDTLLIDKTPSYARFDERLARAEILSPFYIWLIRHPLGVANSSLERKRNILKRQRSEVPILPYSHIWFKQKILILTGRSMKSELRRWTDFHNRIERFLSDVEEERKFIVQYEELVKNPQKVIEDLCSRLGMEKEDTMLDLSQPARSQQQWGIGDEKIKSFSGIESSSAYRWSKQLSESILTKDTIQLMQRIGVQTLKKP